MDRSVRRENTLFRSILLFIVYSVVCRYLFAINRYSGGENYVRYMLYIEILISIPLLLYTFSKYSGRTPAQNRRQVLISLFYLFVFGSLNTLLFSDIHTYLITDFAFWCLFYSMFFLGASENFWRFFLSYAIIILLFSCIESILELTTNTFTYFRGAVDESSYLYDIQMGFDVIPILLVYCLLTKQKKWTIVTATAFVFFFILQFFFQKRLPLLRILLITLFTLYACKSKFSKQKMANIYIIAVVITILAFSLIPAEYFSATTDRFFERGSIEQTTETDSRFVIAERAIEATMSNPRTFLFGYGLGGTIEGDFISKTIFSKGKEINGIAEIEVGAVTIFFRYGIFFFIFIFGKIVGVLLKYRRYKNNPLALACWVYLMVFIIMTFVGESFPSSQTPLNTLMVGGSLGYLCSPFAKNKSGYFQIGTKCL